MPKVLILKDDALDFFESFYNELSLLEPYLSDCSKVFLPKIKSYYSLKFIGLLNCLSSFCKGSEINPVVSLEQTEAGIELARFFVSQAINTIELYSPETRKLSELQTNLIRVLHLLGNNVKDGRLYFEPIVRELNKITPFCVEGKALGSLIKGLGLTTDYGTGHRSYVLYEDRKIDTLFKRVITKRTRELT